MKAFYLALMLIVVGYSSSMGQNILWSNFSHPGQRATYDASFSANGNLVISGSECHEAHVRIFDASNGNILWDYQLDSSLYCVQGVKFSASGTQFVAAEETGNLLLFDYSGPVPFIADTIVTGNVAALSVDFNAAGTNILMGCYNYYRIYDITTGLFTANVNAHSGLIWSAAYSHSGQSILTGATDNRARIHDLNGNMLQTFTGHLDDVMSAKFTSNDSIVVTGARDDKIKVWNAATGALIRTITGHTGDVMRVDISPDDRFIASASTDATVRIWDLNTGAQLASIIDTSGLFVYSVQWSPDGTKLLVGNGATQVILYNVASITGLPSAEVNRIVLVYPNPISGNQQLNFAVDNFKIVEFYLYDITGKLVQHQLTNEGMKSVMLNTMPAGSYSFVLKLEDGGISSGQLQIN
jgi:WD40 repeat protein